MGGIANVPVEIAERALTREPEVGDALVGFDLARQSGQEGVLVIFGWDQFGNRVVERIEPFP